MFNREIEGLRRIGRDLGVESWVETGKRFTSFVC